MVNIASPLRYPGGKSSICNMISQIIIDNKFSKGNYVEPYAGGCGLALSLLFKGYVHELHLNDIDRSIYCFWQAILNDTDRFIRKIRRTPVTIDQWYKQYDIQQNKDIADDFDLAFSSFFLNRTNRSGIILKAGVIGGLDQKSNYKIDCRFNKPALIERIRRIKKYEHRIHFYNMDAIDFIKSTRSFLPIKKTFYCIDPPYFSKGSSLYTDFYIYEDHVKIAKLLNSFKRSWVLTYDNAKDIKKLYKEKRKYLFDLNYSAAVKRVGTELLITSDNLIISRTLNIKKVA